MSAEETYKGLVRLLTLSKELRDEDKPVFWLGAGCSVADGLPTNAELLRMINGSHAGWGSDQYRFDRSVFGVSASARSVIFDRLKAEPKDDSPYFTLVKLLDLGYASVVATFNIDRLLDAALQKRLRPGRYRILFAPEYNPSALVRHVFAPTRDRNVTVVKLHGDVESGINFMTSQEIVKYGPGLGEVCARLSERPAIICGYSFFHLNVLLDFHREQSPMFYINPTFPDAPMVLSLMSARNREAPHYIDGPLGRFEQLMAALERDVIGGSHAHP